MTRLTSLFYEVKKTFFPRWDPTNEWKIQRKTRLSEGYNSNAMCNRKDKTIEINQRFTTEGDNELRWLIAHEICHAVAKENHGLQWQKRFLKVADQADLLGQQRLANSIREDVELVRGAMKPTLGRIYQDIEDALMDQPDASFEVVIEWVANNWDYNGDELCKKHSSLRRYFDKAKRDALSERDRWEACRDRMHGK